jgi:hypothetical protein
MRSTVRLYVSRKVNVCFPVLWCVCCFLGTSRQVCEVRRNLSARDDSLSRVVLQGGLTAELVVVKAAQLCNCLGGSNIKHMKGVLHPTAESAGGDAAGAQAGARCRARRGHDVRGGCLAFRGVAGARPRRVGPAREGDVPALQPEDAQGRRVWRFCKSAGKPLPLRPWPRVGAREICVFWPLAAVCGER